MRKNIASLSIFLAGATYLYLVIQTITSTGEGLSISTFALLGALGWITSYTSWRGKANPGVPIMYAVGASATAITLLFKGRYGWTGFDTLIAGCVFICIVLLLKSSNRIALAFSVIASAISFIPFIILTWKAPAMSPIVPNVGFLIANILALVSVKSWTIEDRMYPISNTILCTLLVLPWIISRF